MLCYVRIYCCKSDHVRLLCSQSAMAYNSVDRCQLKTGTRPFPLLHASAVNRYDEACARGSGVRVFLPRPLAFAAALRCSIGVRRALQPCGWRALVQRAPFCKWRFVPRDCYLGQCRAPHRSLSHSALSATLGPATASLTILADLPILLGGAGYRYRGFQCWFSLSLL